MAHLAAMTSEAEANARPEMRMDMVKPRPPMMPTAATCTQSMFLGSLAKPILTRSSVTEMMPSGLPRTAPKKTPRVTGSITMAPKSAPTRRSCALTKANSGRMRKFTGVEM